MAGVTSQGDSSTKALVAFQTVARSETAYPLYGLNAARQWAIHSHLKGDFPLALEGYRRALEILPKVAWLGSDIISQQSCLVMVESEDVASLSAACAMELGYFEDAVELLDSGRSLFWQQVSALQREEGPGLAVISPYTTTLSSLIRAQKKAVLGPSNFVLVNQPNTRGQESLPRSSEGTDSVLKIIHSSGGSNNSVLRLRGSDATVQKVLESLDLCSWVHFACHEVHNLTSGTKSGFVLHDGVLPLSQIASKRLACGQLAFLSACHAAAGLASLPGVAMHLAAALQFVGFPTVVATMSGIKDEDALRVYDLTYQHMLDEEQRLDPLKAAVALNYAVRVLRKDESVKEDRWIPFIHVGV